MFELRVLCLVQTQQQPSLRVSNGEFWCPLCRQLSNTALPIMPDVGPAVVRPPPKGDLDLVRRVYEVMESHPITPVSVLTRNMGFELYDGLEGC